MGLIPVFPTLNFPNHYSIATGIYPESQRSYQNYFTDPVSGDKFSMRLQNSQSSNTEKKKSPKLLISFYASLIWEVVKRSNAFLVKEFGNGNQMVQVREYKDSFSWKRFRVVLATTKTNKQKNPSALVHKTVMKKEFSRMAKAVANQVLEESRETATNRLRKTKKYGFRSPNSFKFLHKFLQFKLQLMIQCNKAKRPEKLTEMVTEKKCTPSLGVLRTSIYWVLRQVVGCRSFPLLPSDPFWIVHD
ncbi:hypothetical protein C5167_020118 [Papaver somniferum]|uniref:Ribosomal L28e/Mak16 domain-containing protein n=1 Tax=Papaver somniferum TaxID=3469 RepID=A0A4Y7ISL8_PAPSO|nr:hypothetical protein C5167_020118 [Papaver somniferum]